MTERQQLKLARIQKLNQRLYRAYLLSQQLREIYRVGFDDAIGFATGSATPGSSRSTPKSG